MIVHPPHPGDVSGFAAEKYAEDLATDGFVYSHTRVMAMNPDADLAFEQLTGSLVSTLGLRNYELVTLAAARTLRSPHCLLAHGRKTLRAGVLDEAQLVRVAADYTSAGLSDAEVAMMAFAERMSVDASAMTDADSQVLRDHGFSDRDIVDIAMAAGARNFLSRVLQALAVPVEDVPELDEDVAAALLSPTRA
ncbi:carboxymuconolactone decarboxylase family protein [Microbacterium sp. DT81.1]|uniref:carboxymuconolactone decarboxylase family protein n=1 Tax=Microbacterium sp. DT81.1 TaxID=3393413 RepID=UPI003CF06C00